MEEKLKEFAALVEKETAEQYRILFPVERLGIPVDRERYESRVKCSTGTRIVPGKKYAKVDVGTSGKYMVDMATGIIYGIKGYGQVHKGHRYGTLDTISEYYWGGYTATRKGA